MINVDVNVCCLTFVKYSPILNLYKKNKKPRAWRPAGPPAGSVTDNDRRRPQTTTTDDRRQRAKKQYWLIRRASNNNKFEATAVCFGQMLPIWGEFLRFWGSVVVKQAIGTGSEPRYTDPHKKTDPLPILHDS